MINSKLWWQSRTLWINIVAILFALLGAFGRLPEGVGQDEVVTAIMAVTAIANVVLRFLTTRPIAAR